MHIGIDGTTWHNPRGFGRYTRCLVEALAARDSGHSYTLVCDKAPEYPVPDNVETVVAEPARGQDQAGRTQMHKATLALGCDLFFFPTVFSFYPIASRMPKVVVIHDTIPERFPELIFETRLNRWLWNAKVALAKMQAKRFITCSEYSAQDLHEILGIKLDRIDVTSMAANPLFRPIDDANTLAGIREKLDIPGDAQVLVYLGGFNRHKNVLRLIYAMPEILKQHPNAFLVIVGRTTGERFWDNVEDLKASARDDAVASKRIVFTGEISDDELALLLNSADALIHPSLYEGFGFPPIEAMACGTPVLGANATALPEVIGNGGLLFDPLDPSSIAAVTNRFLSDEALQAELAVKAIAQSQTFSWELAAELTEQSFEKAMST